MFFFFSSRRRHTSWNCDWSSDVCSSDLLRAKADTVVESELARLDRRLGDLDARTRREIAQTMGRIADKLLHGPMVRVKELAGAPGADSYETALRVLFELDPEAVEVVSALDDDVLAWSLREAE